MPTKYYHKILVSLKKFHGLVFLAMYGEGWLAWLLKVCTHELQLLLLDCQEQAILQV